MLFCTSQFCVFFLAVFLAYWATPWQAARTGLLLAASVTFYATWNPWLALLVLASSTLDFLLARAIEAARSPRRKRLLLYASLAANLGILGYLKYANFFLHSLETAVNALGAGAAFPVLKVVLPIGISFYTFEAISYVVDVYCGRIRAERNLAHFLLFILFFPHLVAGPIVRAGDFLPQIGRRKRWNWARADAGLRLILLGLVKKLAFADRLALYADPVFADPAAFSSAAVWVGATAFLIQLYCDFSGYSDLALGLAHLLGFHLVRNFDLPFLSVNLSEFWRRWHVSLSTWLRNYVFTPLGGGRRGRRVYHRNVLIVMTVAGLWHGAGWNFVLFGVTHGVLLFAHRLFKDWCEGRPCLRAALDSGAGRAVRVAVTFTTCVLTAVLFRSTALATAGAVYARMLWPAGGAGLPLDPRWLAATLAAVAAGHALGAADRAGRLWQVLPRPVRGLAFGSAVALALVLTPPLDRAFVYFQF
jgi:alginate O-acetyltransferase complex protein AlgI